MRTGITLAQLRAFVQVAETCSFRAAAEALHVSQPALSRTIRNVEALVGARLFDRDTRHVAPTPVGAALLPIARRVLEPFDSAFGELSQFLDGRSGHVTVAALPSVGVALLPRAIATFRGPRPDVQFSLIEGQAEAVRAAVHEGRADLGVSVRPDARDALHFRPLADDPFVLLCRRDDPLAARTRVGWSAFVARPFIASRVGSSIRPATDAAFLRQGLDVPPALEYPSVAAAGALVEAGLGITALPRLALRLIHGDALAAVPLHRPALSRTIGLVLPAARSPSPVAVAFADHLRQVLVHAGRHGTAFRD